MRARGMTRALLALVFGAGLALTLHAPEGADAAEVTSGRPGESFTITLSGAKAGRAIRAELAGSTASATADGSGRARLRIRVPDVEAGEYTLHLSGGLTEDVRFRILHKPGQGGETPTAAPKAAPVAPSATPGRGGTPTPAIKDPASLVVGVGLVLGGISALLVINARGRARRRRFVPVGFG